MCASSGISARIAVPSREWRPLSCAQSHCEREKHEPGGAKASPLMCIPDPLYIVLRLPGQRRCCWLCNHAPQSGLPSCIPDQRLVRDTVHTQKRLTPKQHMRSPSGTNGCRKSGGCAKLLMQGQVHTCEEEGVMRIPGGMLLWLEQGIEIPETAQEETCLGSMYLVHSCWHLLIPNLPGSITLSILGGVERFQMLCPS